MGGLDGAGAGCEALESIFSSRVGAINKCEEECLDARL
jgi:hypothetical protein